MKGKKHLFWLGKRFILALDEANKFSHGDKEKILNLALKTISKTSISKFLYSLDFYLVRVGSSNSIVKQVVDNILANIFRSYPS